MEPYTGHRWTEVTSRTWEEGYTQPWMKGNDNKAHLSGNYMEIHT